MMFEGHATGRRQEIEVLGDRVQPETPTRTRSWLRERLTRQCGCPALMTATATRLSEEASAGVTFRAGVRWFEPNSHSRESADKLRRGQLRDKPRPRTSATARSVRASS
jgi:hypothetical protein